MYTSYRYDLIFTSLHEVSDNVYHRLRAHEVLDFGFGDSSLVTAKEGVMAFIWPAEAKFSLSCRVFSLLLVDLLCWPGQRSTWLRWKSALVFLRYEHNMTVA